MEQFARVVQLVKVRLISDNCNPQVESLVYSFLKVLGILFFFSIKDIILVPFSACGWQIFSVHSLLISGLPVTVFLQLIEIILKI